MNSPGKGHEKQNKTVDVHIVLSCYRTSSEADVPESWLNLSLVTLKRSSVVS